MTCDLMTKLKLIILLFFVASGFYSVGFISAALEVFPYTFVKTNYQKIKYKYNYIDHTTLESCTVAEITELPDQFSTVIGHAYGAHKHATPERFLAPKVYSFLLEHSKNIDAVIFTGDVFSTPGATKWRRLVDEFSEMQIFVAPGNHDVLNPDFKKIFFKEIFDLNNPNDRVFPFFMNTQNFDILIDNSIENRWSIDREVVEKVDKFMSDTVIARHDTPIRELKQFSNDVDGEEKLLPNVENFVKDFKSRRKFTWIIGDGGASEFLPRLVCKEHRNHKFIVNGIGEVKHDVILILHEGEIYQYLIGGN